MNPDRKDVPPPRAAQVAQSVEGVLVVDKPAGPTSHDIVDRARKILGIRRIGHGGTLDPMATGVLVLLVGKATKLSNYFLGSDKAYEGTITFGVSTDSHDAAGRVLAEGDPSGVTEEDLRQAMQAMVGDQMQTPPQVSAVKVGGVPMYKRARKGQITEVRPRLVHIYRFVLRAFDPPCAEFEMACTKGTYVRKVAADLGEVFGCGAHLSRLRRTRSGEFSVEDAVTMKELVELSAEQLVSRMIPVNRFSPRAGVPGTR